MQKAVIQLEPLVCPSCMQKIEHAVKLLNGIRQDSIKILFNASKVRVNFDSDKLTVGEIEKAIETLGYEVISSKVKPA